MKSARIFAFLLACPFLASNAFSQASATATATAGAGAQVMERYVAPKGLPRPVPKAMHTASLDFTVIRDTDWQDVSNDSEHSFLVNVHNASTLPLSIYFSRTERLAAGWISSVCWGQNCYTAAVDSMPFTVQPNANALLTLDLTPALGDEPDSSEVWLRVGVAGGSASDTILLPFYATYIPPNPPLVFRWRGNARFDTTYHVSGPWMLTDYLENHAGGELNYLLSLQDSLPSGWNLTFDLQRNPNGTNTEDTIINLAAPVGMASLITNFSGFLDTTYQQPITFTLNAPANAQPDSAVVYLSVHPQTSNPADSANYRFALQVQTPNSVAGAAGDRAGLAVTNAWPNPLPGSSALHLEVLTDEAGPAKAILYDLAGTEKGTLDLGTLREGTNELQLNIPSLASGEYIIRVNQGTWASEVVRINYIK